MNVYIREKDLDYSAMRGPCPEGFHIPSKDDWGAIVGIWEGLGLSVDSGGALFSSYLKMPFAGERTGAGTLREQGSFVYGWSCTNSNEQIYFLRVGRYGGIHYTTISGRGMGYSLRAFKDAPVKPDSSWTVIYDGSAVATGAGIFYNATLGLISLSSDGFSRKTIQDKNLGAENVGDYGSLFQRGNNYGFPSTGTLSDTSDTQVDASSYGPGNYYSSSTYITTSESPYDRSSVRNDNLWGWNTGTTPIMTTMKNAYVGEYLKPREPGANTLAYWPFEEDMKDYSGNGRDWSIAAGSVSYADNMITITDGTLRYGANIFTGTGDFTILRYRKLLNGLGFKMWNDTSRWPRFGFGDKNASLWNNNNRYVTSPDGSGTTDLLLGTMIRKDNSIYYYENGVLIGSNSLMPSINITGGNGIQLGGYGTGDNMKTTGTVGNLIVENIAWTTDDILDYHRRTKAKYGMD